MKKNIAILALSAIVSGCMLPSDVKKEQARIERARVEAEKSEKRRVSEEAEKRKKAAELAEEEAQAAKKTEVMQQRLPCKVPYFRGLAAGVYNTPFDYKKANPKELNDYLSLHPLRCNSSFTACEGFYYSTGQPVEIFGINVSGAEAVWTADIWIMADFQHRGRQKILLTAWLEDVHCK